MRVTNSNSKTKTQKTHIRILAAFLNNMETKKQEESTFELKSGALNQ